MGVERPNEGSQAGARSGNTSLKLVGNPSSGTVNTHPVPLSIPDYRTRMPYSQNSVKQKRISNLPVIQRTLPEKHQDPKSFVIPCTLGDGHIRKALCDLRASINLMPSSLIRKLGNQDVKPTRICLQLADGSTKFSSGVVEDMIVRVGPFAFPTDFMVLNMEEHKNVSIILGRPYLATGKPSLMCKKGEVTLQVDEDEFVLNAVRAMQYPDTPEECMKIDIIDPLGMTRLT
ncbi:uncharacterized protein LOC107640733 [Arachis ipaensis]|uniref:uncharacterized protein LOC107640733 n=1 Tax=Arachis ipaensis TaxID=130454 RepID=UPI0007AFBC2A|nr:uncharacterized protein LOC107640733 [Arachis ipaensis]